MWQMSYRHFLHISQTTGDEHNVTHHPRVSSVAHGVFGGRGCCSDNQLRGCKRKKVAVGLDTGGDGWDSFLWWRLEKD